MVYGPRRVPLRPDVAVTVAASALFWLPKIENRDIPMPATRIVEFDFGEFLGVLDGEYVPELERVAKLVRAALMEVGMPAFIRTDLASAKHDGPSHYKIETPYDVERVLVATFEDNVLKFDFGPQPEAFLVREWLDIHHDFTAFRGHPIGREWRFFARAKDIDCQHFYWPEDAIAYGQSDPAWREQLAAMAARLPPMKLEKWAKEAAYLVNAGTWSIDFAHTTAGWHLIDMAPGGESWHPEHA